MDIYMRDIIAILVLVVLFYCKIKGMDGLIDTSLALIIGYYFSKRMYEEKNK